MASSTEYRYKYLNKFSHARARLAAWFNHEATCSQRHRHPSTNSTAVLSPCLSLPSRHGVQRPPGWVVVESGLLGRHRHTGTHTCTHPHTHTHTPLLVLQVYPHQPLILERDNNVLLHALNKLAIIVLTMIITKFSLAEFSENPEFGNLS